MIPCRCGGAVEGNDAARSCARFGLAGYCCVRRHDRARANPVGHLAVREQRAALCSYRRYAAAAYVVTYYPPAPLVVATTASGARLTDMFRICHGAFVGASLAWLWLWRWLGWTERCNTAQCIDANMLPSRAWRKLHFRCLPLHRACCTLLGCMLHASCIMLHAA